MVGLLRVMTLITDMGSLLTVTSVCFWQPASSIRMEANSDGARDHFRIVCPYALFSCLKIEIKPCVHLPI